MLSRNSTSHIYNEEDYEDIKEKILDEYIDAIEKLLSNISEKVILFGSRAKKMANFNSHIDLCINYLGVNKGSIVEAINKLIGIFSWISHCTNKY
ncbi:hypothetical protein SAMN02745207_00798 [Clostridium grantii DSM 8605]|uniref:Nucleotidyltransferase domain-containing protein n=1 Tax=Clostridium grantii DSM 8605 TaxID=1121316 RepID=A0A1M5S7T6_9CLOT|nr:hypothetical protein SAMN02745207_00798 [Clostridium grantii DSM 8605]